MTQQRNYQLDSLRAIAAAIVVFAHTRSRGSALGELAPLGVALFFVLSGFLITGILLGAREAAVKERVARSSVLWRFYVRRFLRIFPLYYAVIAIAVLLHEPVTRQYLAELATYRTNFLLARLGKNLSPITPLWSLAVEEHFYLFWPFIVLFCSRRAVYGAIGAMIAGPFLLRGLLVLRGAEYQAIAYPTYCAVDSIALGCLLAMLWKDTSEEARAPWIARMAVAGLLLELCYVGLRSFELPHAVAITRTLNTMPFSLACVWVIDQAARNRLPAPFRSRVLAFMGLVSYATYVLHRYVMHYVGFDQKRGWGIFAMTFALCTAIAAVSWIVFEGPINNLKRFVPYVKRTTPSSPLSEQVA